MITLGVESTAHTFGVGICVDDKIITSQRSIFTPQFGGIHPREAAEHHALNSKDVFNRAMNEASIEIKDIDLISFSQGPGLGPCLRIGSFFSRYIASKYNKKIVGVNHPVAHIEVGRLTTGASDSIDLYVSGGNTQIISFSQGRYRIFGETLDIPIGNALDSFAIKSGMGHPGGPKIEKLAKKGNYIKLPYVVKGMDLSFSGIITEAIKMIDNQDIEDICFSLQETCFAMLIEVTERALAHLNKKEVLLIGGVAANKRFQEMLQSMCTQRGAASFTVPHDYAGDNGAMIAYLGYLSRNNSQDWKNLGIIPKWRAEDVEITWR